MEEFNANVFFKYTGKKGYFTDEICYTPPKTKSTICIYAII